MTGKGAKGNQSLTLLHWVTCRVTLMLTVLCVTIKIHPNSSNDMAKSILWHRIWTSHPLVIPPKPNGKRRSIVVVLIGLLWRWMSTQTDLSPSCLLPDITLQWLIQHSKSRRSWRCSGCFPAVFAMLQLRHALITLTRCTVNPRLTMLHCSAGFPFFSPCDLSQTVRMRY